MTFTVTTDLATLGFTTFDEAHDAAASLASAGFAVTMGYAATEVVMAAAGAALAAGLEALLA